MVRAHQIGQTSQLPWEETLPPEGAPTRRIPPDTVTWLDGAINYQSELNITTATAASEWNTDWSQWEGWKRGKIYF